MHQPLLLRQKAQVIDLRVQVFVTSVMGFQVCFFQDTAFTIDTYFPLIKVPAFYVLTILLPRSSS